MREINVFVASSSELENERIHIGDLFNDINSLFIKCGEDMRCRLLKWEYFDPSFKGNRKQTEYDKKVDEESDIFIVLFKTKAGEFTLEECDVAIKAHAEKAKPKHLVCLIENYKEKEDRQFVNLRKSGDELVPGNLKQAELVERLKGFEFDGYTCVGELKEIIIKIIMREIPLIIEGDTYFSVSGYNLAKKRT